MGLIKLSQCVFTMTEVAYSAPPTMPTSNRKPPLPGTRSYDAEGDEAVAKEILTASPSLLLQSQLTPLLLTQGLQHGTLLIGLRGSVVTLAEDARTNSICVLPFFSCAPVPSLFSSDAGVRGVPLYVEAVCRKIHRGRRPHRFLPRPGPSLLPVPSHTCGMGPLA